MGVYGLFAVILVPLFCCGCIPRAEALHIVGNVISHFEKAHPSMKIQLVLYKQGIFDLAKAILDRKIR